MNSPFFIFLTHFLWLGERESGEGEGEKEREKKKEQGTESHDCNSRRVKGWETEVG